MSIEIKDVITNNRKKINMTQDELAKSLNVSNKVISNWETGRSYPDVLIIPELAKILEIEINEFFTEEISKNNTKEMIDKSSIKNYKLYIYIANLLAVFANVYIFAFHVYSIVLGIILVLTVLFILFSIGLTIVANLKYKDEVEKSEPGLWLKLSIVYLDIWYCNINILFFQMTHIDFIKNTIILLIYYGLVYLIVKRSNLNLKFSLKNKIIIIALSLIYLSVSILFVFEFIANSLLPIFFFILFISIIFTISILIIRTAKNSLGKK